MTEHFEGAQTKQGMEWVPKLARSLWLGGAAARGFGPFFIGYR
jgi:hypothetical protein